MIAEALGKLRKAKPALTESNDSPEPNFEEVDGRNGKLRSARGNPVSYRVSQFLVSNLEDVNTSRGEFRRRAALWRRN